VFQSNDALDASLKAVRKLSIMKQGLERHPGNTDRETMISIIKRISLLQLDSINVVDRSHYLVMFSRLGNYSRENMDALLYPQREVFEQWAHAQCIIPMIHYRYFAPLICARRNEAVRDNSWHYLHITENDRELILQDILKRIRNEGPLMSRHFATGQKTVKKQDGWWEWKPHKHAIQVLFDEGYLMVHRREGFQRFYDLSERVLPEGLTPVVGDFDESRIWFAENALSCIGAGTIKHVADYYRRSTAETKNAIKRLIDDGKVQELKVEGIEDAAYILTRDVPLLKKAESNSFRPKLTTFLSPFDNLIWDRKRTLTIFGFSYRISVYDSTKEGSKNREGYYVMPILHKGRLIGRIDPKVHRESKTLLLHSIKLESGISLTDDIVEGIRSALKEFMIFNNSKKIVIESSNPETMKRAFADI